MVRITLLGPIMKVVAPEQCQGSLTGDINRRRGQIRPRHHAPVKEELADLRKQAS